MATEKLQNSAGQIRQMNEGDLFGELWSTRNIDLSSNFGKVKLAHASEQVASDTDLGGDKVEGLEQYDGDVYILTDNNLYNDSSPYNSYSLADSGPASGEDMCVFDGELRIAENTEISSWNGSSFDNNWWTTVPGGGGTALDSTQPHCVITLRAGGRDTISVTDGNKIRYYNSAAGHTSISWDNNMIGICQAEGLNEGWVGTYNNGGREAQVIRWQVGNDLYTQAYTVNASAVLAIEVIDNVPYIFTEKGEVQRFNQAGFTTIAKLPIQEDFLTGVETGLIQTDQANRPVHPKGMKRFGKNLLININTEGTTSGENANERCPSGVWEVDTTTGSMWHRSDLAGENRGRISGPLLVLNDDNSRFYYGAQLQDSDYGVWREDLSGTNNRGSFTTVEYHGANFEEHFHQLYLAALQDSDDSCVVKYRLSKSWNLPVVVSITWTETNQFTTTDDLSNVVAGDEVEVISGNGSGYLAHITEIVSGASTYTVTIDESVGTVASTATASIDNWKKLDTHDTEALIKRIGINETSPQIQFKVYLQGDSGYPEISRMDIKTNSKK